MVITIPFSAPAAGCDPAQVLSYLRGLKLNVLAVAYTPGGDLAITAEESVLNGVNATVIANAPFLSAAQMNAAAVSAGASQSLANLLYPPVAS